jgi:hypothetical protein
MSIPILQSPVSGAVLGSDRGQSISELPREWTIQPGVVSVQRVRNGKFIQIIN